MSFKHNSPSTTLQTFEQEMLKRGLVKQASAPLAPSQDIEPTTNLTVNLLKLCEAMRSQGMISQAQELEHNFLQYKQASALYDVSGETGEDLVNKAHPEGSHKMEGVVGDAIFETILDKHLKILEKVNKKPTGKIASHQGILSVVKTVLASNKNEISTLLEEASQLTSDAVALARKAGDLYDMTSNWADGRKQIINELVSASKNDTLTNKMLDYGIGAVNALIRNFQPNFLAAVLPGFLNKGITNQAVHLAVNTRLDKALTKLEEAKNKFTDVALNGETKETPKENVAKNELLTNINKDIATKQSWLQTLNDTLKKISDDGQKSWVSKVINVLSKNIDQMTNIKNKMQAEPNLNPNDLSPFTAGTILADSKTMDQFGQKSSSVFQSFKKYVTDAQNLVG